MHHAPFPEWLAAVRGLDSEDRLTFPVPTGHMGRGFGFTRDDGLRHRRHDGVDIGGARGESIVAARGGLVVYSDNGITGMGNAVILVHPDGTSSLYAHCRATHVFAGQIVRRGEVIAEVGDTGFANAPHLHFEWRVRGRVRDPGRRFIRRDRDPALALGSAGETGADES
jgi:murein DD-endopeptidase MepM/ murein hydrolase activator NlpD